MNLDAQDTASDQTAAENMTGTFHLPSMQDLTPVLEKISTIVIDDDPGFRYLCVHNLRDDKSYEYITTEADSYASAVAAFDPDQIDCVLIDFDLGDRTARDFMEHVFATYPNWFGPIVVITAAGSESVAVEMMRDGAADYLSKQSMSKASLQRAMGNALEKARLKRAVYERNRDLELANAALERRNNEISRFYHRVSHEIKTPLTAAQMLISTVHEGLAGEISDRQKTIISQALDSCNELTMLFNDLVECTRLDAGKLRINRTLAEVTPCVERAVLSLSSVAEKRNVNVTLCAQPSLPLAPIDPGRIVQIVANLVGNGIKFTPAGGHVAVSVALVTDVQDTIRIDVADNGQGIAPEHLSRIFDRLYQVNEIGDAAAGAGLGLGLTIASELTALHDGRIVVDSTPGAGSTFSVFLPTAVPA